MKRRLFRLFLGIIIVCLCLVLGGCNKTPDQVFEIHTDLQKEFLAGDYRYISSYADGKDELSKPKSVKISWDSTDTEEYVFYLSENKKMKDCKTYITDVNSIELWNLKINTMYYWYVSYNGIKTDVKSFMIESSAPRNLNIDGLTNVRDLGGYQVDKKTFVNQGMIYRCSRLNENETTDLLITELGIKQMLDDLGIKSELDVRRSDNNENGGLTSSPLGDSVNYYSIPMKSGGNCILLNKTVIKDVFEILGDEDNYPVVIHCSIGTDRTGMICFLINALLGVSLDDLYKDYLFSNFGNIGGNRTPSIIEDYLRVLDSASGDTLALKTYNYLVSIGVNEEDIDTLKNIMLKK